MAYSGSYTPKNKEKYMGDATNITYRSLWERKTMEWLDHNPDVIGWESEETVIPYRCKTDGEMHRYFCDFRIVFKNNKTVLVEVKPAHQVRAPQNKGNRIKFLSEAMTYAKNISKWEAARNYASARGWAFQVWSEETLEAIGIKVTTKYKKKSN